MQISPGTTRNVENPVISEEEEMENESSEWHFRGYKELEKPSARTIKGVLTTIRQSLNNTDQRSIIPLGHGDPSGFPSFQTTRVAVDAIVEAVRSAKYNCYAPSVGILEARRSIAEYLSCEYPYKLSPDDVYLTAGAKKAIEVIITVLACPGANILLPRPGYPRYEAHAAFSHLEVRHFDLLLEKGWEVDLNGVEALADDRTVAIVIINPGNPCGNVLTYEHLQKIAETARKLGILVIADEAYGHLAFGSNPFVSMGVFGSTVPVLTIGSLSKRWLVPGWRLGWIATSDPNGILQKNGVVKYLESYVDITSSTPATFTQGVVPQILKKTPEDFYSKIINLLRESADICYDRLKEIPCVTCPHKPEGSMFAMIKLNLSMLEGIKDDMDFCIKLAEEESVIILPAELSSLEDGLGRIKHFCLRHAKKQ